MHARVLLERLGQVELYDSNPSILPPSLQCPGSPEPYPAAFSGANHIWVPFITSSTLFFSPEIGKIFIYFIRNMNLDVEHPRSKSLCQIVMSPYSKDEKLEIQVLQRTVALSP